MLRLALLILFLSAAACRGVGAPAHPVAGPVTVADDAGVPAFGFGDVRPGATDHADAKHGAEKYPPSSIRDCLRRMATPWQYYSPSHHSMAFICRLTPRLYGWCVVDAAARVERTCFSLPRKALESRFLRDGYRPIVPLEPG